MTELRVWGLRENVDHLNIHSPSKCLLSVNHGPVPGDRRNEGQGGSLNAENVSHGDLKIQNVSGLPGPSPYVGDVHLLPPVPSTIAS